MLPKNIHEIDKKLDILIFLESCMLLGYHLYKLIHNKKYLMAQ